MKMTVTQAKTLISLFNSRYPGIVAFWNRIQLAKGIVSRVDITLGATAQLRGRNGFSKAGKVVVMLCTPKPDENCIYVEVFSKRLGKLPPVMLNMTAPDAVSIGRALVAAGMGVLPNGTV